LESIDFFFGSAVFDAAIFQIIYKKSNPVLGLLFCDGGDF
jgi:hypothetical protein